LTEGLSKTEAVGKLVSLAKEVEIKENIDWADMTMSEDSLYELMASNAIEQMYTCPEDHREGVMLATLTKLLVENFALSYKLDQSRINNVPSE